MILCRSLPQKTMIIKLIITHAHILCCHLQPLWSCYLFPDPGAPQGVQVHFGPEDHYVCQWKLLALISALDGSEKGGRMGSFSSLPSTTCAFTEFSPRFYPRAFIPLCSLSHLTSPPCWSHCSRGWILHPQTPFPPCVLCLCPLPGQFLWHQRHFRTCFNSQSRDPSEDASLLRWLLQVQERKMLLHGERLRRKVSKAGKAVLLP